MSHRTDKQDRMDAIRAFQMQQAGYTNRRIAQELGWDVKVVPARIKLGQRLLAVDSPFWKEDVGP